MSFSPAALFASVVVSAMGLGFFLYGKRQARPFQLVAGLTLMIFPYFVESASWMLGIAAVVVAGLWLGLRSGWSWEKNIAIGLVGMSRVTTQKVRAAFGLQ
ncbi:MAG: hypothetical protein R3C68_10750 [Myxococcota bacterium]